MSTRYALRFIGLPLFYAFFLVLVAIALFPIFYAIMGSFKSNMDFITGASGIIPKEWHFENYVQAWNEVNFARYTFNSILVTACAIAGSLVMTSMGGYVFARGVFPGKKMIMNMFLATMFLATGAITIFPIFSIIRSLNLNGSLWGLIIVYIFSISVANIYLMMAYIKGIPQEIDEAAIIDGCGFFTIYARIIMPLCLPITATVALLLFKFTWNDYMLPMVFTLSDDNLKTLTVGVTSLKNSGGSGSSAYNLMLAGTTIALGPMILFYSLTSKFFVSGITAGALKG